MQRDGHLIQIQREYPKNLTRWQKSRIEGMGTALTAAMREEDTSEPTLHSAGRRRLLSYNYWVKSNEYFPSKGKWGL